MNSIKHNENEKKFFMDFQGSEAKLSYSVVDDKTLDFYSTFVPTEARGQGLAQKLVKAGLEYAQTNNLKIRPTCSYVEVFFKKHPEFENLKERPSPQ